MLFKLMTTFRFILTNSTMANVGLDSFLSSLGEKLEPPVKHHLKNVYASLAISLLSAAVGSYVHLFTSFLQANILTTLISFALLILLSATPDNGKNQTQRFGYLVLFAFISGINLGPLLQVAIFIDPTIVSTALIGTALIFLCFTLSALVCNQKHYLFLGGSLLSGLTIVSVLGLSSLFFGSKLFFEASLYLGLVVMCGFILYDTQLIIAKRRMGDKDFIWHAISLFIDFVNVFRYILILLSNKESKKKNSRD